jgi:sugar lactone lactonase YvrE
MKKIIVTLSLLASSLALAGDKPADKPAEAKADAKKDEKKDAKKDEKKDEKKDAKKDEKKDEKKPAEAPPPVKPVLVIEGFQTPESVLWDEAGNRYLVSNIGGAPTDKDNNGYITVLTIDGKVKTEKWIAAGENGVTLNAPKGMGIDKGVLFVTDIDVVRTFDAKTGAHKGDIELKGASFLNDIAVSHDHKVYVSDTGVGADFKSNGSDAVWVIEGGKTAKAFYANKDLGGPNGLAFLGKELLVNCFGSSELFKLDAAKGKVDVTTTPSGGGDGLYVAKDRTIWTSSWGANAIYKGKLGGTFEVVISDVKGPADFAVNTKKKQLVLPRFQDNTVEIYDVK